MGLSLDFYKSQIVKLLPVGRAWEGSNMAALVASFANEIKRACDGVDNVIVDAIPDTTTECITDWERICGLPDVGNSLSATIDGRRQDIISRLRATGGQDKLYFIGVAAGLGRTITISDGTRPFCAGSFAGELLYGTAWVYVFTVHVTDTGVSDARLEYLINKLKPAHTIAIFVYEG